MARFNCKLVGGRYDGDERVLGNPPRDGDRICINSAGWISEAIDYGKLLVYEWDQSRHRFVFVQTMVGEKPIT